MSLSNRRIFLTSALSFAALSACGFSPVYGPGGTGEGMRGALTIAAPNDANSYELVKRLEERLGRNLSAPYVVEYDITISLKDVGVTSQQEITRTHILGDIKYKVKSSATGKTVNAGNLSNFTAYSSEGSTVSTASAERDAYRRLMVSLADMMVTQFAANFAGWGE
jgi:LPS-assembly lipoprotein